jgi:hypothetical protein
METDIGATESVSTAVIRAVSAVTGRKPDSLPQLTEVVDPTALDALFDSRCNDVPRPGGRVSFIYTGCRITVDNGEFLTIDPLETTELSEQVDGHGRGETRGPDRETHSTAPEGTPGSLVCFVCQRPIRRENLCRERGELVHSTCQPDLRCGISIE